MDTPIFIHRERLADLAVEFPGAIDVFNKYNLDYCCGGNFTLEEACLQQALPYEQVLAEILEAKPAQPSGALRMNDWSNALLIDFIEQNHHSYVRTSIPMVKELMEKVVMVHGGEHPSLHRVQEQFNELAGELEDHMKKEEMVLFPALRRNETGSYFMQHIDQPIGVMLDEHQSAGSLLKSIRVLTNDYTPPADACPTYTLMFEKLKEFDQDLINHIHLENNILFKRVMPAN